MLDIAAASMGMHASQLQQAVGISVQKKAMDSQEAIAMNVIQEMMPQASAPSQYNFEAFA